MSFEHITSADFSGKEFLPNSCDTCSLCGSSGPLTGEHKIKASLIRREFGNSTMHFWGQKSPNKPKSAQSSKSKFFHFDSKICLSCNSSETQSGDRAFDHLHDSMLNNRKLGQNLTDDNYYPMYSPKKDNDLDVFRYFAKILCCYMAEVGGPRPRTVANFAIGKANFNPVFLRISFDESYEKINETLGSGGFAQHGGLKLCFDDKDFHVNEIVSSISVGGIKYEFGVRFNQSVSLELIEVCPEIVLKALSEVRKDLVASLDAKNNK